MSRVVKTALREPDLVGLSDIAKRLGVQYRTAVMWRRRKLLPEPLKVVARTAVWDWYEIERWAIETGRLT